MKRVRARHLNCAVCGGSDRVCIFELGDQPACFKHSRDGTPFCISCLRFKVQGTRFINIDGNRQFCENCLSTSVMDKKRLKEVFYEIRQFFKKLKLKIDKDIPICLVDSGEMANIMRSTTSLSSKSSMCGLTMFGGVNSRIDIQRIKKCIQTGESIHVVKETKQLTYKPKVMSIIILFGYSRLATAVTMAHEMMHAWLRIQGLSYSKEVEEGLCDVISHMWIKENGQFKNGLSQFEQKLKDILIYKMEKYDDPIFKEVRSVVETLGLERTLKEFCKTKKLPSISTSLANLRMR